MAPINLGEEGVGWVRFFRVFAAPLNTAACPVCPYTTLPRWPCRSRDWIPRASGHVTPLGRSRERRPSSGSLGSSRPPTPRVRCNSRILCLPEKTLHESSSRATVSQLYLSNSQAFSVPHRSCETNSSFLGEIHWVPQMERASNTMETSKTPGPCY